MTTLDHSPLLRERRWFLRTWTAVGLGLLLAAAWALLAAPLRVAIGPVFLAAFIVWLLNPAVSRLERAGVNRGLSTLLLYVTLLGAGAFTVVLVSPSIASQTEHLIERLPSIAVALQDFINGVLVRYGGPDAAVELNTDVAVEWVRSSLQGEHVSAVLSGASQVGARLFWIALTLLMGPVLAFYALLDLPRIRSGIQKWMPSSVRSDVFEVAGQVGASVTSYIRGQLIVSVVVGALSTLGLALVGVPYWALLGLLAGVTNVIPTVGPLASGAVGVLVALTVGNGTGQAVAVGVVLLIVQQIDSNIVSPNIVSRTVQVRPAVVALVLLIAGASYGVVGMLVAVPVVASLKLVVLHVLHTRYIGDPPDGVEISGASATRHE